MVRIMIKGGVWKNTEDEILKAAVMKYGKNQWARVASLLARKSAKQCKARWYEWLDPSIKKTDWTRDEEEKLLHMAKLMPNQWRTISPIVGRTAAQCLEHYERLLDLAQDKEATSGGGAATGGDSNDPRRLRPGEIDPHPETKPARPDPIDMDEDEKEMLSEARARLANTRGKKAKRKAREKQLEQAKRLATLQKRRELKAAGIEQERRNKRRKYIDYGKEIPFQKNAPAGFYDTAEEKQATKKARMDPTFTTQFLHKLEEKRRDEEEEQDRKKDQKKIKRMMKADLPQQVLAVSNINDPISVRRRTALNLPAPAVSAEEMEMIVRAGAQAAELGDGGEATQALLGDYRERATPTPMRTPATPLGEDVVMQEAKNLVKLRDGQTPLLGGDNPDLEAGTGFGGSTPRHQRITTPNVLVTTPGGAGGRPGATPLRTPGRGLMAGGETPLRTPLRDQLGLNQGDVPMSPMSAREEKARQRHQKDVLRAQLAGLPAPQFVYEVASEELPEEADVEMEIEEDAAAREERLEAIRRAEEEAEYRRRTEVLKRGLPRPITVSEDLGRAVDLDTEQGRADSIMRKEMVQLLNAEARKYPVSVPGGKKKTKKRKARDNEADIEVFDEEDTHNARLEVQLEMDQLIEAEGASSSQQFLRDLKEDMTKYWEVYFPGWAYFADREAYAVFSKASSTDQVAALRHQFETVRTHWEAKLQRIKKVEEKLSLVHKGYSKRGEDLAVEITANHQAADTAAIERAVYKRLHDMEAQVIPRRTAEAKAAFEAEVTAERELQAFYKELSDERQRLVDAIAAKLADREQKAASKRAAAAQAKEGAKGDAKAAAADKVEADGPAEEATAVEVQAAGEASGAGKEGSDGMEDAAPGDVVVKA